MKKSWLEECILTNPYCAEHAFHLQEFKKWATRGFPSRREEQWKYTQVGYLEKDILSWSPVTESKTTRRATLVFINGYFAKSLSDMQDLPKEVTLYPLSLVEKSHVLREFDVQRYPFAVLNSALLSDGIFLSVPDNCNISAPIHLLFLNANNNNFITCPRNVIQIGKNSQVHIIEEYAAENSENYFTNAVTEIDADQGAKVFYYKIQQEGLSATHISASFIKQKKESCVKTFFISNGGRLDREDLHVSLSEPGAECYLHGLYKLNQDGQHTDHHVHVDHLVDHGKSEMAYKGILDKKSRAVFNGKVFVHKNAQKTNAYQTNHNLLLSSGAEVNTKPELEIYADDIKCAHGATVGQLNPDALFYLCSRGIEKQEALQLLISAFSEEIINKIEHPVVRKYIQQQVGCYEAI